MIIQNLFEKCLYSLNMRKRDLTKAKINKGDLLYVR